MDIPIITNGLVKQKSDVNSEWIAWLVHFFYYISLLYNNTRTL